MDRQRSPPARPVDRRLRIALAAAWRAHRRTAGRFDPRVLLDLERLGYASVLFGPGGAEARTSTTGHAPASSGRDGTDEPRRRAWLTLERTGPCAELNEPIDLGGIGKGLALRWAHARVAAIVAGAGPEVPLLLEAGGDLVATGYVPDGGPWRIGIEDPRGGDAPIAVVGVDDAAVATSSVAVNSWRDATGRAVHHLIDPRTGEPGRDGLLVATVLGRDPAWAEVWSKALFLEGSRGIGPGARSAGLAAWWVTGTGDLAMTPAARPLTIWTV